jgi:hypothetical protein
MKQTIFNKAHRDKFIVVFDIPKALKDKATSTQRELCGDESVSVYNADSIQFSIFGTPVPTIKIDPIDVGYAGQVHRQTSYSRPTYTPLTLGMSINNNYKNYWLLWSWLNLWNDTKTSVFDKSKIVDSSDKFYLSNLTPNIEDYITTFKIYGLDEYNNKMICFTYTNIVLIELSEIEFSYRNTEEIGCTASFVFDQLHVELLAC